MEGITSLHSVSGVFVSVTKLLAINTAFIKGKPEFRVSPHDQILLQFIEIKKFGILQIKMQ